MKFAFSIPKVPREGTRRLNLRGKITTHGTHRMKVAIDEVNLDRNTAPSNYAYGTTAGIGYAYALEKADFSLWRSLKRLSTSP
jgi:hypothetical protein